MVTIDKAKTSVIVNGNSEVTQFEHQYKGLSTDTKPSIAAMNALFLELDTGDFYYFNGSAWAKVGE